ncbi:MAG TPA: GH3 auxin-responsive promoter family protein [Salinivirgaceae bacterium]|nr:GH3 auxin-responsive promoter family protein [Salinivirgaceae bacterium]
MLLFKHIVWLYSKSRIPQIENYSKRATEIQFRQIDQLLHTAKKTIFGQEYKFSTIKSVETFQNRVPVHDYETIKPYIKQQMTGANNVLWPGRIRFFAKSSGTTADKSKFIPITRDSLKKCHFKGGWDVLGVHLSNNPRTAIFSGKTLTLGGSTQINQLSPKSYFGDLSAILIGNTPSWVNFVREPHPSIALIENFELKVQKIAESTLHKNIVALAGVPSWNLVLIKEILRVSGKERLEDVWPNIELFIHGGVSFLPYQQTYKELITSPKMQYLETYNASEGFFALQNDPNDSSMLLMLDYGIFYEFVPLDQIDRPFPTACTVADVELNKPYAMVISTNGGLWRYMIGDVVEFTSKTPPKIKIVGRTKQYINVFGEELMVHNALTALQQTCTQTGAKVIEFTVAPMFMGSNTKGAHQWLIEFETLPQSIAEFSALLDKNIQSLNSDYEAKRFNDTVLMPLNLIVAQPGLFYQWMKQRGKMGGQNKIPLLSNDRKYMDELLEMNSKLNQNLS